MKHYFISICEPVNTLPYIKVEQIILKSNNSIRLSDNLFIVSTENSKLRLDEVCFIFSDEGKANVFVVEIDKHTNMSWNIKVPKLRERLIDYLEKVE